MRSETNETKRMLLQYTLELREQVSRTWTQHYGDLQLEAPPSSRDVKKTDSRLECWMTPVRWVKQSGPNCGLAVLAMASRPVLAYEVAAGVAGDGGSTTNDDRDLMQYEMKNAMMRSIFDAYIDTTPWPKHLYPPTLAELQHQAIIKGFSGRGEMFSTKAMASLAAEYQCSRYNIRLVKQQSTDKKSSFQQKIKDVDDEDGKIFNNANFKIEIFDCAEVPLCSKKHEVPTTKLSVSMWKLNIVERLMNGNLIAVCFDCDKNMMPCSTNNGHTAHWGLLCGVVIEMPHTKPSIPQYHHHKKFIKFPPNFDSAELVVKNQVSDDPNGNIYGSLAQVCFDNPFTSNDNIDTDVSSNKNGKKDTKSCKKENPKIDLHVLDPDRVWVVARHGKKGGRYAIWSLTELDNSNQQLRTPDDMILQTISPELLTKWGLNLLDIKQTPWNISNGKEKSVRTLIQKHEQETSVPPLKMVSNYINTEPIELTPEKNLTVELKHSGPLTSLPPPQPPPPPPPLPPSISKPLNVPFIVLKSSENNDKIPYILPEGPRLDHCLASQFVAFEPVPVPFFVTDHAQYQLVDEDVKKHKLMSPLLCHFSLFRKPDL